MTRSRCWCWPAAPWRLRRSYRRCPAPSPAGRPHGGSSRKTPPAAGSPASEAARLKRDTLERLTAYRQKDGLNSLAPLAAACGKVDEKVISAELLARMLNRERFPVAIWREVAAALDKVERKKGADTDGKDD